MDIATIFMGTTILIICVLPFVLVRNSNRKRDKEVKEALSRLAAKSNGKVDEYDRWNKTLIGIDNSNQKLFFLKKIEEREIEFAIDLSDIQMARVITSHRSVVTGNYNVIQKLQLGLIAKNKDIPETILEFYNADHDSLTIMEELRLVEKWSKIVNSITSKKSTF